MKWSQALKDYQSYLRIERGLSQNTIASYSLDIKKLMQWLEENSIRESPEKITEYAKGAAGGDWLQDRYLASSIDAGSR